MVDRKEGLQVKDLKLALEEFDDEAYVLVQSCSCDLEHNVEVIPYPAKDYVSPWRLKAMGINEDAVCVMIS